jgi:hypothetical protein
MELKDLEFKLTKDNETALIYSLINSFFYNLKLKNKEECGYLLEEIKNIKFFKNYEAEIIQKTFLTLIDKILKKELITYSALAKELNQKHQLNIPENHSAMGRKLGNILGSLTICSYINAGIGISVYVVKKNTNHPGKGFKGIIQSIKTVLMIKENFNEDVEKYKVDLMFDVLRNKEIKQSNNFFEKRFNKIN